MSHWTRPPATPRHRGARFGVTAHQTSSGEYWSTLVRKAGDLSFPPPAVPDRLGDQFARPAGFVRRARIVAACTAP
jgi:hypothetical protein